jgi:hypothetical protein
MLPLTPIAVIIIGAWMLAHLTHIALIVTVICGVVAIILAAVDLLYRGHRVR